MLDLQERVPLLESLRPPEGFALDAAIGTTYSLDLLSLLVAPIAFTQFSLEETGDGKPRLDPTLLLESLRRNAERMVMFCQTGQTYSPSESSPLFAYLENLVVELDPGTGGVFHPKVWVLRFTSPTEPVRYRLLSASRNLTFDRCWDSVVCLEGELSERKLAIAQNHPLGDLLAHLPRMVTGRGLTDRVREMVSRVEREVRRVRFEVPKPFDIYSFWAGGVGSRSKGPLAERCDRLFVMSPFCSAGILQNLVGGPGEHILVSQPSALECLPASVWNTFQRVMILSDAADEEDTTEAETVTDSPTGLHAKIFVFDQGRDATVWTGSANATDSAFKRNVEFLVGLTGSKSACGVDAIFGPRNGATTIADLALDFPPPTIPAEQDQKTQVLEEARAAIARAGFKVTVEAAEAGQAFRLTLAVPRSHSSAGSEVETMCWPVSLKISQAQTLASSIDKLTFGPLALEGITSFFAFEVAFRGPDREAIRFVLNLPIEGLPPDRGERLLKSILKDSQGVSRFIGLLLLSEYDPLTDLPDPGDSADDQQGNGSRRVVGNHLFEQLVRALHRNPASLDWVERLVEDLAKDSEGASILPPGFEAIWRPILEARRKMRA